MLSRDRLRRHFWVVRPLAHDDDMHVRAKLNFSYFGTHDVRLLSSSYVLLETLALLHRRIGLAAVADFQSKIVPLLEIVWADAEWHAKALQRLFTLGGKDVSLGRISPRQVW